MEKLLGGATAPAMGGSDMVFGFATTGSGLFENGCFSLTRKQRAMGFVICFGLGCLLSFLSTLSMGSPVRFSVFYSSGNLVALFSTAFLVGPWQQVKNMFHKKRVVATIVYLAALVATLVVAIKTGSTIGVLCLIAIQFCALVWYTASYIPFARDALKKMLTSCFS